jgi:hypothetical protein
MSAPEFGREVSQELIEFLLSVSQPEYAASRFDFINNVLLQTGPVSRFREEGGREGRIGAFYLAQR